MSETTVNDENLKVFGTDFQHKCLSALISDKAFLERMSDIIDHTFFETDAYQWICKETKKYFYEYKTTPTLTVFKVKIDDIKNDEVKEQLVSSLKQVYSKIDASDLVFVKEQFLKFCKNQTLKKAIMDSVDHLHSGDYEKIKSVVDQALKAGVERNVGHVYEDDIELRMTMALRKCVSTGMPLLDNLLDGGLGAGELGIIAGSPGGGKCVGPNTEIEIEYVETGLKFENSMGETNILWFGPFERFTFNNIEVFGWQVDNMLYELKVIEQNITGNCKSQLKT